MKAIIDKQTNKCKGFGFIDFETTEDAQSAIAELQKKGVIAQLAKVDRQLNVNIFVYLIMFSLLNNKNKIQLIYILLIWILKWQNKI